MFLYIFTNKTGLEAVPRGPPVILHVASPAELPKTEVTIGEAFKTAGYETALIGWFINFEVVFF